MQNLSKVILLALIIAGYNYQVVTAGGSEKSRREISESWFQAAANADLEKLQTLTSAEYLNAQDQDGRTALILACREKHEKIALWLLKVPGIDVNTQDDDGYTALMATSFHGNENIAKLLLQNSNINVNIQNIYGSTALINAAAQGHIGVVKLLLNAPEIDVNIADKAGFTPLIKAARFGNSVIVKLLLATPGINILAKRRENGIDYSALQLAEAFEHPQVVQAITDKLILCAFEAVAKNDLETLKAIIEEIGINEISDSEGNTLLDKAYSADTINFVLQNAKDPLILLARFPFEFIQPSSDIFKFFLDLAYAHTDTSSKKTENLADNTCAFCSKKSCEQFCAGCNKIYYCSVDCQKKDWATHKTNCKKS